MDTTTLWQNSTNNKTTILLAEEYFLKDYRKQRTYYSALRKKEFPEIISISKLISGIGTFTLLPKYDRLQLVILTSDKQSTSKIFLQDAKIKAEIVDYSDHFELVIDEYLKASKQSYIIIADDGSTAKVVEKYKNLQYPLMLFKQRKKSKMPTDLPYQFIDYLSGLTLGLAFDEL